ncbi:hypothetical protein Cni_G12697 [Canna indica]|uniref:Uncharacterized protein n=1 Tax=Canna indica TaxID=4628 RepID=A0AAQ3QC06_9LILI|nr:hypothetical protein Cni_G12697 [Canna indica]
MGVGVRRKVVAAEGIRARVRVLFISPASIILYFDDGRRCNVVVDAEKARVGFADLGVELASSYGGEAVEGRVRRRVVAEAGRAAAGVAARAGATVSTFMLHS